MRILYVCADRGIPVLGHKGASVHVRSITAAMHRLGHHVTVAARQLGEGNAAPAVDRLVELPPEPLDAEAALDRLIRECAPELVIERYSLQSGAARSVSARHGLPLTLEVNAPLHAEATRFRGLDEPAGEAREHATLRGADRLHVVSRALEIYARAVAPAVPVACIPNGADVAAFRTPSGRTGDAIVVGFAGSMKSWHGVDVLLEAVARLAPRHPALRLRLVGSGPEEARLRKRATTLGIDGQTEFTGAVAHRDVPPLVAGFDVAVAPYHALEQFYFQPLKVIEYLAAGRPVVYTDQGDIRSLVGDAGIGVPPGSAVALATALDRLLDDDGLRERMAGCARRAGAALDWSAIAERVVRFAATGAAAEPVEALG